MRNMEEKVQKEESRQSVSTTHDEQAIKERIMGRLFAHELSYIALRNGAM